jgi:DNA-directed RNA polymerase specialized sigma24 family protein
VVSEDAEAEEGGGFDAQDDGAQADRVQAGGVEFGVFVWCEVAFGPDPDGGVSGGGGRRRWKLVEHLAEWTGVRLQRGDERVSEGGGRRGGESLREGERRVDEGEPVLAALLACFQGEALPFPLAIGSVAGSETDYGALGQEWDDVGGAQFDGLFDDPVHGGAFGHGHGEHEPGGWGRGGPGRSEVQVHRGFGDRGHGGWGGASGAVEYFQGITRLDPEHGGGMARLRAVQHRFRVFRRPFRGWKKESHDVAQTRVTASAGCLYAKGWTTSWKAVKIRVGEEPPPMPPFPKLPSTQWTRLEQERAAASGADWFCEAYRPAILAYIRREHAHHDAEDLCQEFFRQVVLDGPLLERADRQRGRLRGLLRTALQRFLHDQRRQALTVKRGGRAVHQSLDAQPSGLAALEAASATMDSPDQAFDKAWAAHLLARAMASTERYCAEKGKGALFAALRPLLDGSQPMGGHAEVGAPLGLSPRDVTLALRSLRLRVGRYLYEEVAATVVGPGSVAEEMEAIHQALKVE